MKTRSKSRAEKEAAKKKKQGATDTIASEADDSPLQYVCVYCGTPCACLYRQLNKNSLSSIKAMHCQNCHRIVDPYIEREGLLVLIDCILLRPEAYRHVLYNNHDLACYVRPQHNNTDKDNEKNESKMEASFGARMQRLVQWTLLSGVLHGYMKWQALLHKQRYQQEAFYGVSMPLSKIAETKFSTLLYSTLMVTSLLDLAAQWLAIYGFLRLLSMFLDSTRSKGTKPSHSIANQIYLGLLLPTSFQIVCVVVLLWENSKTSIALGSLLVAFWQSLAILLVSVQSNSKECSTKMRVLRASTPLVGILSLLLWRLCVGWFLSLVADATDNSDLQALDGTLPCVGFEVDLYDVISMFTNKNPSRRFKSTSLPLPLCLT